jgi:hypothetical protein
MTLLGSLVLGLLEPRLKSPLIITEVTWAEEFVPAKSVEWRKSH